MWKEFKAFIAKGNVVDLAVAFIMGGAFGKIVGSLVNDVLMQPVGLLLGRVDFSSLYLNLSGTAYPTFEEARKAGAPTINYGLFINTIIGFVIVAAALFFVVRTVNRMTRKAAAATPAPAPVITCPFCLSSIPLGAVRCPYCTSMLEASPA